MTAAMVSSALSSSVFTPMAWQFRDRAAATPNALAFAVYPTGATTPTAHVSWSEWYAASCAVALRLIEVGVGVGDRVAVLAGNRPMWPIVDMAVQMVRAIGVGIYPTSTVAQVAELLDDARPSIAFAAGEPHIATLREARTISQEPSARALQIVGEHVGDRMVDGDLVTWSWDRFLSDGALLLDNAALRDDRRVAVELLHDELDARLQSLSLDDDAALIYTSGSTGVPKGARISHRYLAASAQSILGVLDLHASDSALSFLPYSHAAERVFGQCTRIATGMSVALVEDASQVFSVAAHFEPTLLGGLPRVFEKLYEAADVARRNGSDPREAISERIGRRCRVATSGGASLPEMVGRELESLGLPILGAYGQTEHLCVAMNRADHLRFDSVGAPMPGTTVRIADDGELLVERSALTFSGHWRNDDATRDAFTADGLWLRTGDRAEIDTDGTLRITGRVKELIALSTGRKIAPLPIEAALTSSPFIAHAVCMGEGRKYLAALLSLRRTVIEAWAAEHGVDLSWPALAHDHRIRTLVSDVVEAVNATLARSDRVQRFAVIDHEFTTESGELTPTMKVVRRVIAERYASNLEAMYD